MNRVQLITLVGSLWLGAVVRAQASDENTELASVDSKSSHIAPRDLLIGRITLLASPSIGLEYQRAIGASDAISVGYWGYRRTFNTDKGGTGGSKYDIQTHYEVDGLTARYKWYLKKWLHLDLGAGIRRVSTKEDVHYESGERASATKGATSIGIEPGVGSHWSVGENFVFGSTWLQVFQPMAVLAKRDADIPAGFRGYDRDDPHGFVWGSEHHDGWRASVGLVTLDLGYTW